MVSTAICNPREISLTGRINASICALPAINIIYIKERVFVKITLSLIIQYMNIILFIYSAFTSMFQQEDSLAGVITTPAVRLYPLNDQNI